MDFIVEHLAIGNVRDAQQGDERISAMLCVAEELPPPATHVLYHQVAIADMVPIPAQQMREAVAWIAQHIATQRILVYCNAGVGRSSSVAIGYLCCYRHYGFGEAVERVARHRPYMSILPNLLLTIEQARAMLSGTDPAAPR